MVSVLLLVLVVLLAAAVVGLILYVRDLRTERRAAHNEVRDLNDQLDRRSKKAVDSSRAVHVAKVTEMFAPLLPQFPAYNVKDVQWVGSTIDIVVFDGLENATQNHFPPDAQVEIWSAPASLEALMSANWCPVYQTPVLYSRFPRTFSAAYRRYKNGYAPRYTTAPSLPWRPSHHQPLANRRGDR
jgi:predicted Holliday junction resolvase-like endonuclease